ncbi:MAG: hypothetical protein MJ089_04880 [Ruminococcus sp.]|nr:hypothetical protein [Ruminococcus sp.]
MDNVFKLLFELIGHFFESFFSIFTGIFSGIGGMFNFCEYLSIIKSYSDQLGWSVWIIAIFAVLLLVLIIVAIGFIIKYIIKKSGVFSNDSKSLVSENQLLKREILRLSVENDSLFFENGLNLSTNLNGNQVENDSKKSETVNRFYNLTEIDKLWDNKIIQNYDNNILLSDFCEQFRLFACSQLNLYYDIKVIRLFVSAFAATRLIILQGISGTGKTSLPYAFGKFIKNPAVITSVQPSWRDRGEIFGYFNEFTKKYNETEILKAMYEASYNDNIYTVILDEMNIARVEYYFADLLSTLEMPSKDEWLVSLVPERWESDPKHIEDGKLKVPHNMWYIGTANNDDSTFAISDKVYDRAISIEINRKGECFNAPETPPISIDCTYFESILESAVKNNPMSEENLERIKILDDYIIEHFRIAFGNRILKQICDFVPAYIGCGGTELEGLDYILSTKVFRKFEALNITYMRDEFDELCDFIDELFGRESMKECKAYLSHLQKY